MPVPDIAEPKSSSLIIPSIKLPVILTNSPLSSFISISLVAVISLLSAKCSTSTNAGVKILGTPYESIDRVEDRELFADVLEKLHIHQAPYGTANSFDEAKAIAEEITFPVLVRPSYVIGGRAMEIVYDNNELEEYMEEAVKVSPEHPILVDKFLEDAVELDVDILCDGEDVFIAGIMEHIE